MKAHQNPEFYALYLLKRLRVKYPDIAEIGEAIDDLHKMINQNFVSEAQSSVSYIQGGDDDEITVQTRRKVANIYKMALADLLEGQS